MKTMTRKEKKKFMQKMALEEELRKIEENTANMGSFAVSQQESSGKDVEGDDIKIDNFSISGTLFCVQKSPLLQAVAYSPFLFYPTPKACTTLFTFSRFYR